MQRRFHVAWFDTFAEAVAAKQAEQEKRKEAKRPIGVLQIRRKGDRFELVERFPSKEAAVINDYTAGKIKKHPRRRMPKVSL